MFGHHCKREDRSGVPENIQRLARRRPVPYRRDELRNIDVIDFSDGLVQPRIALLVQQFASNLVLVFGCLLQLLKLCPAEILFQ